ncbi:MAG: hypothetical protein ACC652_14895, partial [Acidimicrobiales bacterium]
MDFATLPLDNNGLERLSDLPDKEVVRLASDALAVPRTELNSFTLHAPLELASRAATLPFVEDEHRPLARLRIASLAQGFLRSGGPVPATRSAQLDSVDEALAMLRSAIDEANPDQADTAATWLSQHAQADEIALAAQGDLLLEMGAAGHAPILFAAYLREPDLDPTPMRGTARYLAQSSGIGVEMDWLDLPSRPAGDANQLRTALGTIHKTREPGFGIWTLVTDAHKAGLMAGLPRVDDEAIEDGFRTLFRVAAHSMITDDPDHAAYGWSHALTMPLGLYETLSTHDRPREALDVATILSAGFRLGHGAGPLATDVTSQEAAPRSATELINAAAIRHDAHLIKFVQACLLAAAIDPDYDEVYRHAAGHLVDWWIANPPDDDPVAISAEH